MAELKETIPFSFDEIYAGIAQKFADKGYDSPYDGSNLAQLITSMAYTTSMLNANTAININETILSLAQKRPNVIEDARMLGYESEKRVSYVYKLEIELSPGKSYNIPKYTKFTSNGNSYYYMGEDIDKDLTNATESQIIEIDIKEGILHKYIDEPDNLRQVVANLQYFDIPYKNVEKDGIEVFVTFYTTDGIYESRRKFERSNTLLMDIDDKLVNKFIRIENDYIETPRIYFVLSGVGFEIPRGAIIEFNVLVSSGENGAVITSSSVDVNGLSIDTYEIPVTERDDITILSTSLVTKGGSEESILSIKANAPLLHNTANRCVTANDYNVICKKHSSCTDAFVFGGEDEHPIKLGNLFFSLTPSQVTREIISVDSTNTNYYRTNTEVRDNNYLLDKDIMSNTTNINGEITNPGIIDNVRALNLPALEYNMRHPIYINMNFDVKVVKYALASIKSEVRDKMFNIMDTYLKTLEKFETEFFKSNVVNILDDYLTDITGLELDVKFQLVLNEKTISREYIANSQTNAEKTVNPYLHNPSYERPKEYAIHIYLDTPFEGIYEDSWLKTDNIYHSITDKKLYGDIIIDTSSYPVLDENGEITVYTKPVLDDNGNPIYTESGEMAIFGDIIYDNLGNITYLGKPAYDVNGDKIDTTKYDEAVMNKDGYPILDSENNGIKYVYPIFKNGVKISEETFLTDSNENFIKDSDGNYITFGSIIKDSDGNAILDNDGNEAKYIDFLLDIDAVPIRDGDNNYVAIADLMVNIIGEPLAYGNVAYYGKPVLDANGDPIIYGDPVMDIDGNEIYYKDTDPVLDSLGNTIIDTNTLYNTLPYIECENFVDDKKLYIDFNTYERTEDKDSLKDEIVFNVILGNDIVGTYSIYNDKYTYIKIKIYCIDNTPDENGFKPGEDGYEGDNYIHPDYIQIPNSVLLDQKHIDLIYPSTNFKTLRSSIFRFNTLGIK